MNSDTMFFLIAGLIVAALVVAGPLRVIRDYRRNYVTEVGDPVAKTPTVDLDNMASPSAEQF